MMEDLEEDVNRAIEAFLATILRAVERAAIAAVRAALPGPSRVGDAHESATGAARGAGHAHRRETAPPAEPAAHTPTDAAAQVGRIVACVGAYPGATVMQLAPTSVSMKRHCGVTFTASPTTA